MAKSENTVTIIGAGPAGLFASECLLKAGCGVALYDRMPSPGRKFLVAGSSGGLNITNSAPPAEFASRYGENKERFERWLNEFSSSGMTAWLSGLGVNTFTGTSGKVFPEGVSAPEILARWMARLESFPAFAFFPDHELVGLRDKRTLVFATEAGPVEAECAQAIFALGGASWPATGSDGRWADIFAGRGLAVEQFESANCGFEAEWSGHAKKLFDYVPLKNIGLTAGETSVRGEVMLTPYGMEGGPVYFLGSRIRKMLREGGAAEVYLDLLPDWTEKTISARLAGGPGKESLATFYRKKLNLGSAVLALLRDRASPSELRDMARVSALLKKLPVVLVKPRPIEEAISSAGGLKFSELNDSLMLKEFPGWFCAGEMLDWESPTGGFLLQGCFATAAAAAQGVVDYLTSRGNERCEADPSL